MDEHLIDQPGMDGDADTKAAEESKPEIPVARVGDMVEREEKTIGKHLKDAVDAGIVHQLEPQSATEAMIRNGKTVAEFESQMMMQPSVKRPDPQEELEKFAQGIVDEARNIKGWLEVPLERRRVIEKAIRRSGECLVSMATAANEEQRKTLHQTMKANLNIILSETALVAAIGERRVRDFAIGVLTRGIDVLTRVGLGFLP